MQDTIPFPYLGKGFSLLLKGELRAGFDFFQAMREDQFKDLTRLAGLTVANVLRKDEEEMEHCFQLLKAELAGDNMGAALFFLMLAKSQQGELEQSLEYLEQGIQYRLPNMLLAFTEPLAKPLRKTERFQKLRKEIFGEPVSVKISSGKYKHSLFDKDTLGRYQVKLETLMKGEEPYLDPGLSLRSLAAQLGLPPNHLSQLLNEGFQKNFSEYINSWRVITFQKKVADPANQHLTLLALAFESGFNSKTAFNTFFKKITGMTPRAYVNSLST